MMTKPTQLPIRIVFICHGNICRSTMAESVFSYLVDKAGRAQDFVIDSAATSYEEIGNPPHRGTIRKLHEKGIPLINHRSRHFDSREYELWDLIVYMDDENAWGLRRICKDSAGKYIKLLSFCQDTPSESAPDVADPWYTNNFEDTWCDIWRGCNALLTWLNT